jgi:hypothetical protein
VLHTLEPTFKPGDVLLTPNTTYNSVKVGIVSKVFRSIGCLPLVCWCRAACDEADCGAQRGDLCRNRHPPARQIAGQRAAEPDPCDQIV